MDDLKRVSIIANGPSPANVRVTTPSGEQIPGITSLTIRMTPTEPIEAEARFLCGPVMRNLPLTVSRAHLEELAEMHGLKLVPKD